MDKVVVVVSAIVSYLVYSYYVHGRLNLFDNNNTRVIAILYLTSFTADNLLLHLYIKQFLFFLSQLLFRHNLAVVTVLN
jgi:hypothetical protein